VPEFWFWFTFVFPEVSSDFFVGCGSGEGIDTSGLGIGVAGLGVGFAGFGVGIGVAGFCVGAGVGVTVVDLSEYFFRISSAFECA